MNIRDQIDWTMAVKELKHCALLLSGMGPNPSYNIGVQIHRVDIGNILECAKETITKLEIMAGIKDGE